MRSQFDGSLYYIFEYVDSDLCRLVKAHPSGLEELPAADFARQLFSGLAHMHQHNFFHRDLKPENVLLDTVRQTIRIADLGQARSLRARPPFTDYVGTRWYRAPECLLRDRTYSSPVDVWASGLIFAELLHGTALFCGTSTIDQLYKIFAVLGQPVNSTDWPDFARLAQAVRFRIPDRNGRGLQRILPTCSSQAHVFLTETLTLNPRRRPVARKCLEHTYFLQLPPLESIERLDTHRARHPLTDAYGDAAHRGGGYSTDSFVDHEGLVPCIDQEVYEQEELALAASVDAVLASAAAHSYASAPSDGQVDPMVQAPDIDDLDAELDRILSSSGPPQGHRRWRLSQRKARAQTRWRPRAHLLLDCR